MSDLHQTSGTNRQCSGNTSARIHFSMRMRHRSAVVTGSISISTEQALPKASVNMGKVIGAPYTTNAGTSDKGRSVSGLVFANARIHGEEPGRYPYRPEVQSHARSHQQQAEPEHRHAAADEAPGAAKRQSDDDPMLAYQHTQRAVVVRSSATAGAVTPFQQISPTARIASAKKGKRIAASLAMHGEVLGWQRDCGGGWSIAAVNARPGVREARCLD